MTAMPNTAVPLYLPEHAANPQRSFALLRAQGPVGLAEIDPGVYVWVITDYRAALDLFHDTTRTWTKDTRGWMEYLPPDSPILPLVQWRPSLFFADDEEHAHLRKVLTDSFDLLDAQHVRDVTRRHADALLAEFAHTGRVDLISQYARLLSLMVLNSLFGMDDEYALDLITAIESMMSTDLRTKAAGEQSFAKYLGTLYQMKAAKPGRDLTSWFIAHPNRLTQNEVINQIQITQGAAYETLAGFIANGFLRIATDERYRGTLTTGNLPIQHAIVDVLWTDPSLAMFSTHRPRRSITFHGRYIEAGAPVMVSYAAINTCPYANQANDGHRSDRRAHLAFAAGPHECPARSIAEVITITAIERVTMRLPDIELMVPKDELTYRPSPFYRILTSLPCRFTPRTDSGPQTVPWSQRTAPSSQVAPQSVGLPA
ncbi:cytochrome P450 [Streptomyces sp. NPDC004237]|uniref:cytochrome P450 n=1 Tax=Streptomyces sp. NPDC004237 TaxID=3154455 RepID=UPI0033B6CF94